MVPFRPDPFRVPARVGRLKQGLLVAAVFLLLCGLLRHAVPGFGASPEADGEAAFRKTADLSLDRIMEGAGGRYAVGIRDLRNGHSYFRNAETVLPAASLIKVFIMVEAFNAVRQGRLSLTESVRLTRGMRVGGAGVLQDLPPGRRVRIGRLIELMIVESDNMATNILIDRLGMAAVNATIRRLGFRGTRLVRRMMDRAALARNIDNVTTVVDMVRALERIYLQECLGGWYDAEMMRILEMQKNSTKLPFYLPEGVAVANKTGEMAVGSGGIAVENDAGIVFGIENDLVICVLTNGVAAATERIRVIARMVFDHYCGQGG